MKSKDNTEKFVLHDKNQILQTLLLLAKNNCLVNATFDSGKYSFITVVIDVLKDKGIVVLDFGPNEAVNKKLLDHAQRVVFSSVFNGIRTQFSVEQVTQAKFKGHTVFAIPIPESLLWLERREFYRVKVPLTEPVHCRITLEDDEATHFNLLDISMTGLALTDPDGKSGLPYESGVILPKCQLLLPEYEEVIDLHFHYQIPIGLDETSTKRIGCSFVSPTQVFQSNILKFMQFVERQKIQLDR